MSKIGRQDLVQLMMPREIESSMKAFKQRVAPLLAESSLFAHAHDLEQLLDNQLYGEQGTKVDYLDELPYEYAHFRAGDNVIAIRTEVQRRLANREPDARFTVFHEISHSILHRNVRLPRSVIPKGVPTKFRQVEYQADYGAMALAIGAENVLRIPLKLIASLTDLPLLKCKWYFEEVATSGMVSKQKNNAERQPRVMDDLFSNFD